jgi:murein L,D-transpeptidase YafK
MGPSFWQTWKVGDRMFAGSPFEPTMNVFEILNVDDALAKKTGK